MPYLGVLEDLGVALDFVLGVRVYCVLRGGVLVDQAVLAGLEHCGRVVCEGAVFLPHWGDGAVAGVRHCVDKVAYGFVGEFMVRIWLVLLSDALLSVDVPLLQVRPNVGYLCSAVMYVITGFGAVGFKEGRQVLLHMPEGMELIPHGCGWLVVLSLGLLFGAAGDGCHAHGCE